MLDGPDGNKIDCMFFPCTSKEEVSVDESVPLDGKSSKKSRKKNVLECYENISGLEFDGAEEPKYLTKATVIMCNPNALYY